MKNLFPGAIATALLTLLMNVQAAYAVTPELYLDPNRPLETIEPTASGVVIPS